MAVWLPLAPDKGECQDLPSALSKYSVPTQGLSIGMELFVAAMRYRFPSNQIAPRSPINDIGGAFITVLDSTILRRRFTHVLL